MTVLLICVNYNSDEETSEYLKVLAGLNRLENLKVVVVDNSESDEPFVAHPRLKGLKVIVVKAERNLGYFGGAALGFELYLRENPLPDWTIVSNVDLRPRKDLLERLCTFEEVANLGVLAPAVHSDLTGTNQNPYMIERPGRLRMHAYRIIFRSYWLYLAYEVAAHSFRRLRFHCSICPATFDLGTPISIYAPHGSCVIFAREFFRRGGSLRYPSFLFGEEIFVAEQARKLQLRVLYKEDLWFSHAEHVSTEIWRSRKMVKYAQESADYCAKKYF